MEEADFGEVVFGCNDRGWRKRAGNSGRVGYDSYIPGVEGNVKA